MANRFSRFGDRVGTTLGANRWSRSAHIWQLISRYLDVPPPGTIGKTFEILAKEKTLVQELATKLSKARR